MRESPPDISCSVLCSGSLVGEHILSSYTRANACAADLQRTTSKPILLLPRTFSVLRNASTRVLCCHVSPCGLRYCPCLLSSHRVRCWHLQSRDIYWFVRSIRVTESEDYTGAPDGWGEIPSFCVMATSSRWGREIAKNVIGTRYFSDSMYKTCLTFVLRQNTCTFPSFKFALDISS